LPEEWVSDKSRCKSAHIPSTAIKYKTKLELALEMITYHKQKGARFHWIGGQPFLAKGAIYVVFPHNQNSYKKLMTVI
jgi:sulfatase maturation enzyme AslB (radical SAM superfamily)